jgi:LysM repeat protein
MRRTVTILILVVAMLLLSTGAAYARPNEWHTIAVHWVRRGETLLCIARAYGVRWRALATYNGIANPNRIYVGQRLYIPSAYGPNPAGPVCARQGGGHPAPGCACATYHTVQPGQNLYRISRWYGRNMWHVARCNGILNLNRIYAGQVLCIP